MNPLVIAYHLIWTGYGWWLPTDPRGSSSNHIRNDIFKDLGELHLGRKKLQPASQTIRSFYETAANKLRFPLITFTPEMIHCIGDAFSNLITSCKYTCYACAILPDHVHLLIRKHKHSAEEMITNLQCESHLLLRDHGFFDLDHPIWGGHGWNVFLDHPDDVRRVIGYVEKNPIPYGIPKQNWEFVKPYDGWPLHPGHSPNSPYVKRMRKG